MARRFLLCFLLCLSLATAAGAEGQTPLRGVALVIGNAGYTSLPRLSNPGNDAREIQKLLTGLGFQVGTPVTEGDAKKVNKALRRFVEDAEEADVALLYYSGHGIEAGGENYLIPIDANLSSLDNAGEKLIPLGPLLGELRTRAKITIVLLDACRTNPFPPGAMIKSGPSAPGVAIAAQGLARTKGMIVLGEGSGGESLGEVIGFAAQPGEVALDGPENASSPYAAAILKHLAANTAYEFGDVMTMVTEEVYLATGARQRPWTNTSLRRFLTFGLDPETETDEAAAIRGEKRKLLLTIARTPEDMKRAVETAALAEKVPLAALYGMLKVLDVDTFLGRDQLEKQIFAGAAQLKSILAQRDKREKQDPELIRLSRLADDAEREGTMALALQYRDQASARADAIDKSLDQDEANIKERRIELAATYAENAQTAILNFDHAKAAEKYAQAYQQVAGRDAALAFTYKFGEADALSNHGELKGENTALRQAIAAYLEVLTLAPRETHRDDWAGTQNNLGNALQTLGEREGNSETLARAVAAYEAALIEWRRDRVPYQWAMTQSNLGNALRTLGTRENGTTTLANAVAAHEAALTELTRERAPLQWATTQHNLGAALQALGERERGTDNLARAVAAYEAALIERTRERVPLQWAMTQNNLGSTLTTLGGRESGTETLARAVAAFEAALTERTRERVPLDWATTQANLGNTLQRLGERESGTENLVRAVAAFEEALTEQTRERVPLQWAMTQNNLGNALARLGERESGTETLTRAIAAYEAALAERTREQVPIQWAATQNNLGNALRTLGERESGTETLARAVAAFEAALTEYTRERMPLQWAMTQNNLGATLRTLGERESGTETLARAVAAFEAALNEWTRERVPLDWAATQSNLGVALGTLGERESGTENLARAVAAYEAALTEQTRERVPLEWAVTQNNLGNALQTLGVRESGSETLIRAVAAYEAALTERTRERVPFQWAATQNNLGNALLALGKSENDTRTLARAVATYEAALTEQTRERTPFQWGQTQNNLGSALLHLGVRTNDLAKITAARQAVEAASDVFRSAGLLQYEAYFSDRLAEIDAAMARLKKR
ncbi:MAG: caspase family protein [Parvibaculaceae bacterium]